MIGIVTSVSYHFILCLAEFLEGYSVNTSYNIIFQTVPYNVWAGQKGDNISWKFVVIATKQTCISNHSSGQAENQNYSIGQVLPNNKYYLQWTMHAFSYIGWWMSVVKENSVDN